MANTKRAVALLTCLACLSLCSTPVFAQAVAQARPIVLSHTPACARCTIEVRSGPRLQVPTDSFWFGYNTQLFAAPQGQFIARNPEGSRSPLVFDSSGRFLRRLMREGQGPGEIGANPALMSVTPSDTVLVYERRGGTGLDRKHVFAPDLRYVRTDGTLAPLGSHVVWAPNASSVIAFVANSRATAGYPLHVIDSAGRMGRSFGRDDSSIPVGLSEIQRLYLVTRGFARSGRDAFWSYSYSELLLERWSFPDRRTMQVVSANDGWYRQALEESRRLGIETGLTLSHMVAESREPGLLWLVYRIQRQTPPVRNSSDVVVAGTDIVIEAFDWQGGCVLASTRLPNTNVFTPMGNSFDAIPIISPTGSDYATAEIRSLRLVAPSGSNPRCPNAGAFGQRSPLKRLALESTPTQSGDEGLDIGYFAVAGSRNKPDTAPPIFHSRRKP